MQTKSGVTRRHARLRAIGNNGYLSTDGTVPGALITTSRRHRRWRARQGLFGGGIGQIRRSNCPTRPALADALSKFGRRNRHHGFLDFDIEQKKRCSPPPECAPRAKRCEDGAGIEGY